MNKLFGKKRKAKRNLLKKEKAFKKAWAKKSSHSDIVLTTEPINTIAAIDKINVGKHSYGEIIVHFWGDANEALDIGSFCSIAKGTIFILGGNHNMNTLSTYPFKVVFNNADREAWTKGKITIEDDVWIGLNVLVLPGVTIGKGAIVAAGSIVTKDVKPYSIVAGNPAKIVKMRFNKNIISKLEKFDFNKLNKETILKNLDSLYTEITEESVDEIISQFKCLN